MTDPVHPKGEALRNAVQWISEQRQERPDTKILQLVDDAALRFDLSPADQETLISALF